MKNQYFGDWHDWMKYIVLRALLRQGLSLTVGWMLTADDDSGDGKLRGYLNSPHPANRAIDPELFDWLTKWRESGADRNVTHVEQSGLLGTAVFHRDLLPDDCAARDAWFTRLAERAAGCDMVFLDPDNGLEVPSRRRGTSNSSKYVYWSEVRELYEAGHSVAVYQHMARISRRVFLRNRLAELFDRLPVERCTVINMGGVYLLVICRPEHSTRVRAAARAFNAFDDGRLSAEEHGPEFVEELSNRIDYAAEERAMRARLSPDALELLDRTKRNAAGQTTRIGAVNHNDQTVIARTDLPGTDHFQRVYVLRCLRCENEYGANGSDLWIRKCPRCQGGKPGLQYRVH